MNELEAQVQAVWQEVLGQERISTHADFFAFGGNSLQVIPQAPLDMMFTMSLFPSTLHEHMMLQSGRLG